MKVTTTPKAKKLMLAALVVLAPVGTAFAAQDCSGDAFAGYNMTLGGQGSSYRCVSDKWQTGAEGPSGPVITSAGMACGRDPFEGYLRVFNSGQPRQLCIDAQAGQTGAQGPAGPTMSTGWSDPFYGYHHTFPAD